jgi:hypothetical protein
MRTLFCRARDLGQYADGGDDEAQQHNLFHARLPSDWESRA